MNRLATLGLMAASGLALAACGSAAGAASNAGAKASPSPSARQRNGAAGELVKINGTTLVLNSQSGDVTVDYTGTTTFQKTSTGTFADIHAGSCIVITGPKDTSGNLTPSSVLLTQPVNGACNARRGPGGPGGFGGPDGSPNPGASPRPTPRPNNLGFVGGQVTAVNGTSVEVKDPSGTTQAVSVPTTVTVNRVAAASASDLALHECVTASGQRDASGNVTAARSITIVPAGPSGCFTGGRGGFGGFGGRRFSGGGGGGGGGQGGAPAGD